MMPPVYKLTYFNMRARAEVARMLFAVAQVEYEDERIDWETEWPTIKYKYPNDQLPVLEIDGNVYCQSYAIQRHLAREFGLAGKTPLDELRADMVVASIEDMLSPLLPAFYIQDKNEQARYVNDYKTEKLPNFIKNLEKMLKENTNGNTFIVGDELTWADLNYIHAIEWIERYGIVVDWTKYPKLKTLREKVLKLPKVAAWIDRRPKTAK